VSERVSEFRSGDRPRHIYRAASFFLFLMSEEEESMKLEKRKDENKFNFFPLRGMQRHKRISLPVSLRKKERKPNSSFSLLRSGCSTELEWIGEDLPTYTASGPEAWTRSVGSLSLSLPHSLHDDTRWMYVRAARLCVLARPECDAQTYIGIRARS